ncbi:MAG: sugar-binding transcriptional regulator [Spirochaetes bacterium]|nr:sugar-binding transcriptional regulator [Spirochaetota bacterium]
MANTGTEDESLLTRISWYYYIQGMTQQEIGDKLGFSRTKIVRLLASARRKGIVQINIAGPYSACLEKEEQLKKRFSLKDAIIIPTGKDFYSTKLSLGKACAVYLEKILEEGNILGIAWGTTLYEAGRFLHFRKNLHLTVVQLMGGLNATEALNPQEIVNLIASKLRAGGIWLNTPAVVANPKIKKALLSDNSVKEVLSAAKRCHKALLGIGDMSSTASLLVSKALNAEDMTHLISLGAVGDIMGWFYDINGKLVNSKIKDRIISVPLSDLSSIQMRIGVACGDKKVKAFIGALRGGHINVIMTDEATAQKIIEYA